MRLLFTVVGVLLILLSFFSFGEHTGAAIVLLVIGLVILAACRKRGSKAKVVVRTANRILPSGGISRKKRRKLPAVGNVDSVCPHCNHQLDKKPGRKKKCPHCGEFIYVRTQPCDEQRVLVTQEQAEKIEEQ